MKNFLAFLGICLGSLAAFSQPAQDYAAFFDAAYEQHPNIPRGMLESIAWTNSRMVHLQPQGKGHDCIGLPVYYGVMGLVEDGKGYFNNNLELVAQLSGVARADIKRDPRSHIMAYAAAYAKSLADKRLPSDDLGAQRAIVAGLSEIPQDGTAHNQLASDQQFYAILHQMEDVEFGATHRIAQAEIDYEAIFGKENYAILSASWVEVSQDRIRNRSGQEFMAEPGARAANCTASRNAANYSGAIWSPANSKNFGSRKETKPDLITIHTVQGSYASAISWFKNPLARVSTHYVIRSFDGQVTQMVCESDKGFHVREDNARAIGIEHEGFINDGATWYTSAMYESSAALVRDIARRQQINLLQTFAGPPTQGIKSLGNTCTRIKGHQHFPGNTHVDPGPFWDWDRYYRLVNPQLEVAKLTDKKGVFTDPGGPGGNYGDQERRAYLIAPKNAAEVKLEFEDWEMEGDAADPYDYLDIWEGPNRNARYLGRFTGNESPGSLLSRTGAFYIEFRSDCQFNKRGWLASYSSRKKGEVCVPPSNLLVKGLYPLGGTLTWQKENKADFYLVYVKRMNIGNQKWFLYKTRQNGLSVTGLAGDAQYQWQIRSVCGADTSAFVGESFMTPPISKKGSAQAYRVRLNKGRFHDSGGPESAYSNNEAFLYTIVPPNGEAVELNFTTFETETDLDVMKIFDGPTTGSRLIGKYSGTDSPGKIISSGNALTVQFTSDSRNAGKGWVANWTTASGGQASGDPDSGAGGSPPAGGGGSGNAGGPPSGVATGAFTLNLAFPANAPSSRAKLSSSHDKDFTLSFEDKDNSGRGLANRFYSLAENTEQGWRGLVNKGFFYDDFEEGLHPDWKRMSGIWEVHDGRLVQRSPGDGNTNLFAALDQEKNHTYIYNWQSRTIDGSDNRRHGIHFFCSDGSRPNRGNSYFVWIRDAASGDHIEIYKVVRDDFKLKNQEKTKLEGGKVYDFKVIYNPRKGRIEVYQNNKFVVSWVDPEPITSGTALSLRTGGAAAEFDNLVVFKNRGSAVELKLGASADNDFRKQSLGPGKDAMRVLSLVVDRRITWSPVTKKDAQVNFSSSSTGGGVVSGGSDSGGGAASSGGANNSGSGAASQNAGAGRGNSASPAHPKPVHTAALSKGVWLRDTYSSSFVLNMAPPAGVARQFFLVAEHNGKGWTANESRGFYVDDFPGPMPDARWKQAVGKWSINSYGRLQQSDRQTNNGNIYLPLKQEASQAYVYDFNARFLNWGDNLRFGLHFFCSEPNQSNRGNSYMIWFRNNDQDKDQVEIYRSSNNNMEVKQRSAINIRPEKWINCKIYYDPATGKIDVYVDYKLAASWTDSSFPLKTGGYLSFRTGGAKVAFDDLRVYQEFKGRYAVGVGKKSTDHMRYPSQGTKASGRIYTLDQGNSGQWYKENRSDTKVKF